MMLGKLDGTDRVTYVVWRGLHPERIMVRRDDVGETFIQAAGSAEAMTVEARLVDDAGRAHLSTLGHAPDSGERDVLVPIGSGRVVRVSPEEVFTASEAAEIFARFLEIDDVADVSTRRELDLSVEQSERR